MSDPPLAEQVKGIGRMYRYPPTDELVPSITSIIDVLDKPALIGWAARETAKAAWEQRAALVNMDDEEAAVDMLKNARFRSRGRKANVGSAIHEVCEALARDIELPSYPEEASPYVDQFLRFVADYDPTFTVVEGTVFNLSKRYAGTFDFLAIIGGVPVIGDYKTGSGIYPEVALQTAAARYAEQLWDRETGELRTMPATDGAIAVHLAEDRYAVHWLNAGPAAFDAFLGARGAWDWAKAGADEGATRPMSPERLAKALAGVFRI